MRHRFDPSVLNRPQTCPYHDELLNHPIDLLQRTGQAVFFVPEMDVWMVTRYDDVVRVLQDYTRFTAHDALSSAMVLTKEAREVLRPVMPICKEAMIRLDPPAHTRVRKLINQAFTPRRVALLEPAVREIVNQTIDSFIGDGQVDLVGRFAGLVPLEILYAFLGIPEEDRRKVCNWSIDWMAMLTAPLEPERQVECAHSMVAFANYMRELIELRRREPQDDFISSLIQAVEEGEAPLSQTELADTIYVLVLVGPETVAFTTCNGMYRLLHNRIRWEELCQNRKLISQFVEEMLRMDSVSIGALRITTEDVTIDGVTIPKGATVMAGLSAANRSSDMFPDPDTFNLHRTNGTRHLSFGHGAHFCLGAPLARLELQLIFEQLTERMPSVRLAPGQQIELKPNALMRSLAHLQVEWDERS